MIEKSGMSEQEYNRLLNYLLKHITLIPEEIVHQKLEEANNILGKIDPDDVIFLSTALSLENSKIWSDDKHFEKQSKVSVFKTENILNLFLTNKEK